MSILSTLQSYLEEYSSMVILTDQTEENPSSYALTPIGNALMEEDCLGNQIHQHSYVFYAKENSADEIDRKENHGFLENFQRWLENKNYNKDFPDIGENLNVTEISVSNGMLFDVHEDGTGLYQIQIQLIYTKENELWQ